MTGHAIPAHAQQGIAPTRGPADAAEVKQFLDGLMPRLLEEHRTAGGVVAVVGNGRILHQDGYGVADWGTRRPIDPNTSMFRIASISKVFVWTAIMQLHERGLVDLDQDINAYLDFEIPRWRQAPVTLSQLMAHTSGFDEVPIRTFSDPSLVRPLGEALAERLPPRIRPPGEIAAYSNHGAALAAYIVERTSGQSWARYVRENILDPLDMRHTTFEEPTPEALRTHVVTGHRPTDDGFSAGTVRYTDVGPAGAAVASAGDMAHFMIAHLQRGAFGDTRILEVSTSESMHRDHHTMDPTLPGMAHGFMNFSRNGERIIGHRGLMPNSSSLLLLLPERGVGVFASFNSTSAGPIRGAFTDAFVGHYYPHEYAPPTPPDDVETQEARRVAGYYRRNVFPHSDVTKLQALLLSQVVRVSGRGTLQAHGSEWIQSAPLRYEHLSGDGRALVFRADEDGRITHYFNSRVPMGAYERVPLSEHPRLHFALFGFAAGMICLTLIAPLGHRIARRIRPNKLIDRTPQTARRANWIAGAMLTTGAIAVTAIAGSTGYPFPRVLLVPLWILIFAALPACYSAFLSLGLWTRREGPLGGRVLHSLGTLACLVVLWQLSIWNILPWRL